MNDSVGVVVKNTSDFVPDFVLTNAYIPNALEKVSKISEMSILNHTNINVSVTDVNGITSKHYPVKINDTFANMVGITKENKYVYVIERRVVTNDDINNTVKLNKDKIHKGDLYNIIHKSIINIPSSKKINEVYVMYQIDIEYLKLKRMISIKEIGISVSLPSFEGIPYGHFHSALESNVKEDDSKLFHSDIVYYHNDPKECIFINILNKTIRVDSMPIESEIEGEGVVMMYNDASGIDKLFIKPIDFKKHNIFQSIKEAKASMAREELLAHRKLDLDLMNIESKIISSITDEVIATHKTRLDMINKKNQILLDMDKIKANKEKNSNISGSLDNTKKYIDLLLMIKKLIFI